MFTPMQHGQNRNSNRPPVEYHPYQWFDTSKRTNIDTSGRFNYKKLGTYTGGNESGEVSSVNQYKINKLTSYISLPPFIVNMDSDFDLKSSSILSIDDTEYEQGTYKLLVMGGQAPGDLILYKDFTIFLTLSYYPYSGMNGKTLLSWQRADGDLYEYIVSADVISLRRLTKASTSWATVYTVGEFPHKYDYTTETNKIILCLTSRKAYIDGDLVMDGSEDYPINSGSQISGNNTTEMSLFITQNVWDDRALSFDKPIYGIFNVGKFSECLVYPRELFQSQITTVSDWLTFRSGL